MSFFPEASRDTNIYPAITSYDIVVDPRTLRAYIALSSVSLLLCFAMLIWAVVVESDKNVGYLSLYPTLNFRTKCELWDRDGGFVGRDELVRTGTLVPGSLMRRVGNVRVRLAAPGIGRFGRTRDGGGVRTGGGSGGSSDTAIIGVAQ